MNNEFNRKVAIFPLQDIAVLPGETISLQIFEPRYRKMIQEVEANDYLLGVSLAIETIHKAELKYSDSPLTRNQDLYQPHTIFGCGPITIKERLADERILIDLHVNTKVEVIEVTQTLPFYLASVRAKPMVASDVGEQELLDELKTDFMLLVNSIDANASMTIHRQIQTLDLEQLIIFILSLIRFSGEFKQSLLEQESWQDCGKLMIKKIPDYFPRIAH